MKNIINRKTIALILLTVFLVCGVQGISHGFFGGIIDVIGDIGGAVGDAVGAVGQVVGIAVNVIADTVEIAAETVGLSIRVLATVIWHTDSLWDIEPFPNGGIIGVVISNLIHLWDPLTGDTTATLTHDANIKSIAFSPDGLLLASAGEDGTVHLWNPQTAQPQPPLIGHTDSVLSVAFSFDGSLLASGSADNTIRLWDPNTGTLQATLRGHTDSVLSVAFSPDGSLLASGSADGTVRLWDPQIHTLEATLTDHTDSVLSVTFSPDGSLLASASIDNTVRLWAPQTEQQIVWLDHQAPVLSIAFNPEGDLLASGSTDGTARLWNLHPDPQAAKVVATLGHESPVRSVTFSPDGDMLYSASADGKTRQWEITIETETGKIEVVDPRSENANFTVTPGEDGTSLMLRFSDKLGVDFFRNATAYVFQWRRKKPQGDWKKKCVEIETGEFTIDNLEPNTTYQVQYGFAGFACFPFIDVDTFVARWSPIAEGTTSGAPDTKDISTQQSDATLSTTDATVKVAPTSIVSPAIGQQLEFTLSIAAGEAVAGYQATVQFDTTALRYVESTNSTYLPDGAFFVEPVVAGNLVKLNAISLAGEVNGDGSLATLTYEVIAVKASTLTLSDVLLTNSAGETFVPQVENAEITESQQLSGDVNGDGTVNIADLVLVASNLGQTGQNAADVNGDGVVNIADLALVAGELGTGAAAPSLYPQSLETLTAADVKQWLTQAQQLNLTDATSQRGIQFLEQLLVTLTPTETALLANYPNPFNPETWIPYQLEKPAEVTITIYAIKGHVVRTLALGHQPAGVYQSRSRAAYWDGKNAFGEPVASGVYFYQLTTGDFTATRKMLIRK